MKVRDSVDVVMELDEKSIYSHIAHESAEDIIRIISAIDAERARLRGEEIYHRDDWDELIRERIRKGKRHTAFDFYNPTLLDLWEEKVKDAKRFKNLKMVGLAAISILLTGTFMASLLTGEPWVIIGLGAAPLIPLLFDVSREGADLRYYELAQFFIYELSALLDKFGLPAEKYRFKVYSQDYRGIKVEKRREGIFAKIVRDKG
ncbi:hypothetical protein [Pyrococcus yayanosii]|uniref:Uncharacterized protein n=1 Tax=Pyrococcus yayanosii (strain CH1 / JCM 16557) TaxID=529709 RepID=F8AER3_PYRYC|nr:hypothetical protein [Pyrococcus yayanosii]AEH24745.1 hypothetical protein PYCH_10640 [Pyrococcus yayanosii CH1]